MPWKWQGDNSVATKEPTNSIFLPSESIFVPRRDSQFLPFDFYLHIIYSVPNTPESGVVLITC